MPDPKKTPNKPPKKDGGYNQETVNAVKNYLTNYYKSDFFRKNLEKGQAGWSLGVAGKPNINDVISKVAGANVKIGALQKSLNDRAGNIDVSTTELPNEIGDLVIAHELGHTRQDAIMNAQPRNVHLMLSQNKAYKALDNETRVSKQASINKLKNELYQAGLDTQKIAKAKLADEFLYNKYLKGDNPASTKVEEINRKYSIGEHNPYHDDAPSEIRADILGLRYLAQKNKIWDPVANPGEKLDNKKYEQIMNMQELNNKGESEIKKRLKLRFSDDAIKYFLNNIAYNKPNGLYKDNNV